MFIGETNVQYAYRNSSNHFCTNTIWGDLQVGHGGMIMINITDPPGIMLGYYP